jgi:hypothetical protein
MSVREYAEVRPRSAGEILDDGFRLYFAAGPLLLSLTGLFVLPTVVALLFVLTGRPAGPTALAWSAAAAALLPLTGLGAGACQEAFHLWAEGDQPGIKQCLTAACRRGLNHVLVQLLGILVPVTAVCLLLSKLPPLGRVLGVLVLLGLSMPICLAGIARHAVLAAGQKNPWKAWRRSARGSGRHPLKALIVVNERGVLLVFAVLNLHLFGLFGLWVAEALGGFDVALARLLCSLGNPPYLIALVGLAWWLLAPYFEAVNYLFFVDDRTRYEGLDLWYRVEDYFPRLPVGRAGAVLLALGSLFVGTSSGRADQRLDAIRAAEREISRITGEVKSAEPYPGSGRWLESLRSVGRRLDPTGSAKQGRYRWYFQSIEGFARLDRSGALNTLAGIAARLGVLEDSLSRPAQASAGRSKEEIKGLVPKSDEAPEPAKKAAKKEPERPEEKPFENDGMAPGRGGGGPAVVAPVALGGLANLLLVVLVTLAVAVLLLGVGLAIRYWLQNRKAAPERRVGSVEAVSEELVDDLERADAASLWRQSDELARGGRFLDAVRTLYLAVLAMLHQATLIRFERTRTNGEYADQLRPRAPVHQPFVGFTRLFEVKWYGERACAAEDYSACRGFAEEIQRQSREQEQTARPRG